LRYAVENIRSKIPHVTEIKCNSSDRFLELDPATMRHLEVLQNRNDNSKKGTLLELLDYTGSAMGGRRLRSWLARPLYDLERILCRHEAVEAMVNDPMTLCEISETICGVRDLERIVGRLNVGNASPRDFQLLVTSLECIPGIRQLAEYLDTEFTSAAVSKIDDFSELESLLRAAIVDHPPVTLAEGGVIREGYNQLLDELRRAAGDSKSLLSEIQQREIESTGIKSLKVKYNSVFGYYIEVSKSNLALVPETYIRKQTLVNAERFITPELKDLENRILNAQDKSRALEAELFAEIKDKALKYTHKLQMAADAIADIDVIASLAQCARFNNYVRPEMNDSQELTIVDGRHPVLEQSIEKGLFVSNDCHFDNKYYRTMILTGPNMSGKSTYIRQLALIVIMAQTGSFVPAKSAGIGLVNRLFTRIGASDDLGRGQSTFMVEMVETSNILRRADEKSFVILDEIGRGTSTFDGLSIAWSVVEHLYDVVKCRTVFATHYYELTELALGRKGINNFNVSVREYGEDVIFLRRVEPGAASRSYGIHVAKLAGLPEAVLKRSREVLYLLENMPKQHALLKMEHAKPTRGARKLPDGTYSLYEIEQLDLW
jgi:DNA mismatch repair protein MutS